MVGRTGLTDGTDGRAEIQFYRSIYCTVAEKYSFTIAFGTEKYGLHFYWDREVQVYSPIKIEVFFGWCRFRHGCCDGETYKQKRKNLSENNFSLA